jgi:hypothetical protein
VPNSRPLTVAIPAGESFNRQSAYCPRRPNLSDILSNNSPPPWTLTAFMAYLSQNHCLETLEFTMDAKRYSQHYEKTAAKSPGGRMLPGSEESIYILSLWQRLMQAYIQPNGAREVNLPSGVRDALLSQDLTLLPPHPETLDVAIGKVHELMEESVLVPFLNSHYPQTAQGDSNDSSAEDLNVSASFDDRGIFRSRTGRKIQRRRSPHSASPPLSTSIPNQPSLSSQDAPPPIPINPHRASAPSAITQFGRSLSQSVRQGFHSHPSSQSPSRPLSTLSQGLQNAPTSGLSNLTPTTSSDSPALAAPEDIPPPPLQIMNDDNDSTPSAAPEPVTPPTTPPTTDIHGSPLSAGGAGAAARQPNPWKRMRYSFGWRKKSDHEHDYHGS